MEILDCIWSGECFKDDSHLKILHSLFQSNFEYYMGDAALDTPFQKCVTDLDRIEVMRKFFVWTPVPSNIFERFQKSESKSQYFRQLASESATNHKTKDELREFNLAIVFGTWNGVDLGLAFLDRAKFFAERKNLKLAQRDTKLAKEAGLPENLASELEGELRVKMKYGDSQEDEVVASSRINVDHKFFKLTTSNPKLEHAESFVEIEFTPDRGRRLIVTKNVNAGEKLLIQEPFTSVLQNYLFWDMQHCHNCLKPIAAGIPCPGCTFALYCDEKCRDKSFQSGHQYEHNCLPYLYSCKTPLRDLVALRIICKLGPQELYRLFERQTLNSAANVNILGTNCNGIYESSTYLPIYHLVSHPDHLRPMERVSNCFRALMLIHVLEDTSEFFTFFNETLPPKLLEQFKNFVASLILHHIENIPYNAISVSKLKSSEHCKVVSKSKQLDPSDLDSESYGIAVFSLLSICNHSCDPNAVPLRRPYSQTVSLIALKNLKPRDEILISYAPLFTFMPTTERLKFLSQRYNFNCDCPACTNNWFLDVTEIVNNYVNNGTRTSSVSDRKSRNRERKSEITKLKENLGFIHGIICDGDYFEGIETLKPFLVSLTKNYSSQFPLTLYAQELLKRALVMLVNQ